MDPIEVPHPGAQVIVGRMLNDALREHPDVQWLGLISEDGFAIASEGEGAIDDDEVAAAAVRMMIQVRSVAKSLGQPGAPQMFIEGDDCGICVVDRDPWVLLMVGAPGVPIGLLRYEAREIAEAFPMGKRAALPEAEPPLVIANDLVADEDPVTDPDGEEEIRWADEPTLDAVQADEEISLEPVVVEADEEISLVDLETGPVEPEGEQVEVINYSEWLEEPAQPAAVPTESIKLEDLAPPAGPSIDLPPPSGPVFDLPPPQ